MEGARQMLSLVVACAVAAFLAVVVPAAHAHAARPHAIGRAASTTSGYCIINSLPSFVDQGEAASASSVADIIEVECTSEFAEKDLKISSQELFSRCAGTLSWAKIGPTGEWEVDHTPSAGVAKVQLDDDGNATVVVWGGPHCASGESLVSAHLEESPAETFTTNFTVLRPDGTPEGITALDVPTNGSKVEDATFSDAATILQLEFPSKYAEKEVVVNAEELYFDCPLVGSAHLLAFGPDEEPLTVEEGVIRLKKESPLTLNDNGNAFVVLLAGQSCTPATLGLEASVSAPPGFVTLTTNFTIQQPQSTWEAPSFTIEKQQEIKGSGTGFTTSTLTGALGQTVDYQIVVTNTGNVPLKFSELSDAHCDKGTIMGGPEGALAPNTSATYTCEHVLTTVGAYTNEATVTGTSPGGVPIEHTSNQVVVEVPPPPAEFKIEKLQEVMGSGFSTKPLTGVVGATVNYEIVVTNTGNVPLTLSNFSDPNCDKGTIVGPETNPVAAGTSTRYRCDHVLTTVGAYTNEATVTGTSPGGTPIEHMSNQVVVEVPPPVGPEPKPRFTIEKLQEINGSGFTTKPVTGLVGETVDYEIVVMNTGNVPLTFSTFSDPNCETGTLAGGPGKAAVAPGAKTTYTCSRVLASVGSFFNVATATGTPEGGPPITNHSNEVEAKATTESGPNKPPGGSNNGTTTTTPPPSPKISELGICERSTPLKGASGPKRHAFTVQTSSSGIKQITFYLDGRKIKTLKQSQAKHGEFTIEINPTRLSYGAHRLSTKTIESNPRCKAPARSSVFVRPLSERAPPKFTG